ncbi:D-alanyl-D-alanine endopeptidase [Pandoraea sp. XJJ-1]|uniref:D-alanyl-D-alanine endopeptidase n=1 Tax=Pandoraea cepalis TaxID=2508294 RepID=A0AAW7ML43_9BURK|nr:MULTISPECIES: D-alanyl-D-alanine endopeptidase [Pandoraea]MDN4573447.1 D-alanyl-D-alanine endopeptidase [Pandoraea cepalis]MDN4577990.1 D-alanyl-D-alanine endopeptidase [Pandoraea cepalis]OJY24143.1 MAG: D-alanyl-D-alanine carboxypeptidase [Pandoraea sp. 64-18]WAL84579.1 D-alanyl-D-alanine endopeptidase [Pandoraea sp. XJJ-1]BDD94641.1 peptidase [Pandoraea sp. NE5]
MYAITTLARLCRSRLWGAAVVAISLAAGAPAVVQAAGKTSVCSSKAAKTAAQKRACANSKATKSVATSHSGAKRAVAKTASREKAGAKARKLATVEEDAATKRVAIKHVVYKHGKRRVVTSYRTVNFTPQAQDRLSAGRAFGLHESPDALALRSSVAYVVDERTGESLFDKNSQAVLPIASISKLMTAMVSLDAGVPMTDMMEVTDEDRDYEKGTGSRLSVGSRLSREDMLHIALMSSENRAAAALSRYFPGGRPAFLAAMNRKAKQLGMNDTHFNDPTGLSSQNVSSARDLVKMVKAAYQYPMIRRFSTDSNYDVNTGRRELHYVSTNHLIGHPGWEIGLQKTGYINEAGQCLVMQANVDGRPVIMILLDSTGKYSRFADATRVRKWLLEGGGATPQRTAGTAPTAQVATNSEHAL